MRIADAAPPGEADSASPLATRTRRDATRADLLTFGAYLLCFIALETLVGLATPVVVAVGAVALIAVLLVHFAALDPLATDSRRSPAAMVLPALVLVPLLRLLSITMPTSNVPERYWLYIVGVPMVAAVVCLMRLLQLSPAELGVVWRHGRVQLFVAASGLPMAAIGYLLVQPDDTYAVGRSWEVAIAAIGLAIFSGVLEEVIFRGALQVLAERAFGPLGVAGSTFLFAATYLGEISPALIVVMLAVGTCFAVMAQRTRSIVGVSIAHAIFAVAFLVLFPLL